jgi:YVTN family beta-propeller protein
VRNERDNTVTVLDGESFKLIKTIPVGERPRGIAITPDYREVWFATAKPTQLRS